jgi:hypothetical protein
MWDTGDPDDPSGQGTPAATNDSGTPAAADGSGTPAPADGSGAPAAADSGSTPAPADGSSPDAVAPCSCDKAVVSSEAVMSEPPNRSRTRLGVGERVRVSYSLGAADWSTPDGGSFSSSNGQAVIYTAPERAATVVITATGNGCSASILFTIVEPNAVHQIKRWTDAKYVQHQAGMPDVGIITNIFFGPDDVNFYRIEWLEYEAYSTATGVWSCINNGPHNPAKAGLPQTTHVQAGMGTWSQAVDNLYSGCCGIVWTSGQTGSNVWEIPWNWRVVGTSTWIPLQTVEQKCNCDTNGLCTITKAGSSGQVNATAGASNPD